MNQPTYTKLAERAKQLIEAILGTDSKISVEPHESDKYFDGDLEIDHGLSIAMIEEEGPGFDVFGKMSIAYQVYTISYNPGVMYHKDGSGTPPDTDVSEYGKPHSTFESAMCEVLKLVVESRLNDFCEVEADKELERQMEEYERSCHAE